MILTPADLTGMYRAPAGLPPTDLQAALDQAEEALLHEFFDEDTVVLIAADPSNAPATTLRTGGGGLGFRWEYVALPWLLHHMRWGVLGHGAQLLKDAADPLSNPAALEGRLEQFRLRLERVRRYWQGDGQVVATTATTLDLSLPPLSVQWVRTGMQVQVGSETLTVQSVSGLTVTLSLGSFIPAVGDFLRFVLPIRLRKRHNPFPAWTK